MPYMMKERKDDEVYVGNTDAKLWPIPELAPVTSLRLGQVALDSDGYAIARELMRPVFVHLDQIDLYNELKTVYVEKLKGVKQ